MRFHRTRTRFILTTTLAAVALLAVPVLAQPGPMQEGRYGSHGPGMGLQRAIDHLDLSAEQREQLEQIRAEHRDEHDAARDRMRSAHERFIDLAHAETLDEIALRDAAAEMSEARADLMVSHAAMMSEMRQILTPEQLEKLEQMPKGRRGKSGGRGHGWGGHGPQGPADWPDLGQAPDTSEE